MKDELATIVARQGDADGIRLVLDEVCRLTDMGFAAVARVTEDRWIACQVADRIEFGLDPGDELEIKTTICNEIRGHGQIVVIDDVSADLAWQRHPTPTIYGFKSYISIPIVLSDGSFWGTLCAIDPNARKGLSSAEVVDTMRSLANRVSAMVV